MSCKKNKPALNFFLKTNPLSVRRAWNPSTTSTWPCPCQELLPRRIKTTFEFVASVCFQTKSKTDFNSNLDRKPPKSPKEQRFLIQKVLKAFFSLIYPIIYFSAKQLCNLIQAIPVFWEHLVMKPLPNFIPSNIISINITSAVSSAKFF